MTDIKLTEIAAWWGASVATIVFLWDIFKWHQSGARVRLSVSPNMERIGILPNWEDADEMLVAVEVVNVGNKKTTITHLFAYYYADWWSRIRRKRTKTLVVPQPVLTQPLPFELEPGARWVGAMQQNEELENLSRIGYLLVGIYHSVANKPILARLVIPTKNEV